MSIPTTFDLMDRAMESRIHAVPPIPPTTLCETCGHPFSEHSQKNLFNTRLTCVAEVERHLENPGYAPEDIWTVCGCEEFVPMTAEGASV